MNTNRYESINIYLNKGIVEAYIHEAKERESPFCIAKFGFDVDLEDGFRFKNIISFIARELGFFPILQDAHDAFLILLPSLKLHDAKRRLKKLEHSIKLEFKHEMKAIGLTLFDAHWLISP